MINKRKLGYRLSALVADTGKPQGEVAKGIGAQESSLSLWINGHWTPSLESMYKIA